MPRVLLMLFLVLTPIALVACGPPRPVVDDDDASEEGDPKDMDGDGYCGLDVEDCGNAYEGEGDCDDEDDTVYPDADEICDTKDNNCDGKVDEGYDDDQDGYVDEFGEGCLSNYPAELLDCNDQLAAIHPGHEELCDEMDNDCNGEIDDGLDNDGDTYRICDLNADCDDEDSSVYPGAEEICDGKDNNCNSVIDDGVGTEFLDQDGDGFSPCLGDCDDSFPDGAAASPGIEEGCDDVDNDCDGLVDEDLDLDDDGVPGDYPNCANWIGGPTDCDDDDPTVYPYGPEFCDLMDNNCNGQIDEELDFDNDGFTSCEGDCQALNPNVNPNAPELCDGLDNDCNLIVDDGWDNDGDGQSACAGDCNDVSPDVWYGAPELCDGIDNDCDGMIGVNEEDIDGDLESECDGDCDETDPLINSSAFELCDGIDNNCDGVLPDDEQDDDLDGYIGCTPLGCTITLVEDGIDDVFDTFVTLDALGLELDIHSDAEFSGVLEDTANFPDSQIIVWYSDGREITFEEHDALEAWLQSGRGLIVTGPDALSPGCGDSARDYADDDDSAMDDDDSAMDDDDSAMDDDDSAADDDDSAGDDDDSAMDDDDSTGDDDDAVCEGEGDLMADLVRSLTLGDGPQTSSCAISSTTNPLVNGPYADPPLTTAYAFTASSTNHENAVADPARSASRVAAVGSKSKIIYATLASGGAVVYWNGNEDLADWDPGFDAGLADLVRNVVHDMNLGCGGYLQGGDCDDSDGSMYPSTCP
jgi:hypothetical protein